MQTYKNIASRNTTHFAPIPCHAIVRQGDSGTLPYSLITIHSTMTLGVLQISIDNQGKRKVEILNLSPGRLFKFS